MLNLNAQKQWVPWPEAGIRLQLSPLTLPLRKKFTTESTVREPDPDDPKGRKMRTRLDLDKFDALVAQECIHGWEGVVSVEGDGDAQVIKPIECTPEAKPAFMRIELANAFVYSKIQSLDLFMVKELKAAGNA